MNQLFEIKILNQHPFDESIADSDYSSHGQLYIRVGNTVISDNSDNVWGISSSALALLKSIKYGHPCKSPEFNSEFNLIVHGCTEIPWMQCPIGIDWRVEHKNGRVILSDFIKYPSTSKEDGIKFPGARVELNLIDYVNIVYDFILKLKDYLSSLPLRPNLDENENWEYAWYYKEFNELMLFINSIRDYYDTFKRHSKSFGFKPNRTNQFENGIIFSEIQKLRQWWIWPIVLLVAGISWWALIQQIIFKSPFGDKPVSDIVVWILFIVFGIGIPVLLFSVKLITELRLDHIYMRLFPFTSRKINLADINNFEVCRYRPMSDYYGWGIHWSPRNGLAYNIYGNKGVQFKLIDGKKILIGSQKAEELAAAIGIVFNPI